VQKDCNDATFSISLSLKRLLEKIINILNSICYVKSAPPAFNSGMLCALARTEPMNFQLSGNSRMTGNRQREKTNEKTKGVDCGG
jgi:hypothetical protein